MSSKDKNRIDEFIRSGLEGFEADFDKDLIWERIEKELPGNKMPSWLKYLNFLLIGAGLIAAFIYVSYRWSLFNKPETLSEKRSINFINNVSQPQSIERSQSMIHNKGASIMRDKEKAPKDQSVQSVKNKIDKSDLSNKANGTEKQGRYYTEKSFKSLSGKQKRKNFKTNKTSRLSSEISKDGSIGSSLEGKTEVNNTQIETPAEIISEPLKAKEAPTTKDTSIIKNQISVSSAPLSKDSVVDNAQIEAVSFFTNPALAGGYEKLSVISSHQNVLPLSTKGRISTVAGVQGRVRDWGAGLSMKSEKEGGISKQSLELAGAYHFKIGQILISAGASGGLEKIKTEALNVITEQSGDPLLRDHSESAIFEKLGINFRLKGLFASGAYLIQKGANEWSGSLGYKSSKKEIVIFPLLNLSKNALALNHQQKLHLQYKKVIVILFEDNFAILGAEAGYGGRKLLLTAGSALATDDRLKYLGFPYSIQVNLKYRVLQ